MMRLGGIISNLLSLGNKLLPFLQVSIISLSTNPVDEDQKTQAELEELMRLLERIKATLYDAEQREISDQAVQLWLKELKQVALCAEDVLDEYHYEVLRGQVEARGASQPGSRKRKLNQVSHGMLHQIQQIKTIFSEIERDRVALQLSEEDGLRHSRNKLHIAPTSHFVDELGIFGREREKEKLIDLLSSETHDDKIVQVVAIVGPGGIGKTTLAQLAYNDRKIRQHFDELGWIFVSESFDVERLTRELLESITGNECGLTNLSTLQEKINEAIRGKQILLVLDDVWNEKISLWDSFFSPLKSASLAKILMTTRNEPVANLMQTIFTLNLRYLSEEQCWQLFEHYAFGRSQNIESSLLRIGKQILNKCKMLPLAVKSIANLLRHEMNEESWKEILESELWESDVSNDIFAPLQLSYTHLPANLKPCLIFCSTYPKYHTYNIEMLVQLWISHGYIESKGLKNAEEIGREYAKQLWQRSFFESRVEWNNNQDRLKLHDMYHDLVRLNSKNECCSIEAGATSKLSVLSNELCHLYIEVSSNKSIEVIPFHKFTTLRTLIITGLDNWKTRELNSSTFDLSMSQRLRALEIYRWNIHGLKHISSLGDLKHLRYLSLGNLHFERLPGSICSLYSLKILKLTECSVLELPTSIGNLISLEKIVISYCFRLGNLPKSLCQLKALRELVLLYCYELEELPCAMGSLTNLQTLEIFRCRISSLPPSLGKSIMIQTLRVRIKCEAIGWLKDFSDLGGTLRLVRMENMSNLTDVQCANLASMRNLQCLQLFWYDTEEEVSGIALSLFIYRTPSTPLEGLNDFEVMTALQPHSNLRELTIDGYGGSTFPEWIENPYLCASLERIVMEDCINLKFLPFGSLRKLKCLSILRCDSLRFLREGSLPPELQELTIIGCDELISLPGLAELKLLVKLSIRGCGKLHWLLTDAEPSLELITPINESSHWNSLSGLRDLALLRSVKIIWCPKLQLLADELLCVESCKVEVQKCPLLREWCFQHGINYKE